MEYSILYYTEEEIEKLFGLHMEKQGELVVVENEAKLVLTNLQTLNSERNLIRSYIVNANLIGLSSVEIFCRYNYNNIKKLKEKKKMGLTKEKNMIDEIKEETTSYSDDSLFNITSFGTDMSFRELITMYEEGDLEKPEMQRNYVWNKNEASRFIDSVLLGLPVPSIFLAKTDDEKRLIVDGYQRIMTVYDYVKRGVFGGDGKSFALSNSENINETNNPDKNDDKHFLVAWGLNRNLYADEKQGFLLIALAAAAAVAVLFILYWKVIRRRKNS